MKLVMLAPANNPHTKKWLAYYNEIGYSVVNVSFDTHKDTEDRSKWKNVKTIYLNLKFSNKLSYFLTVSELKAILKQENPDLLHSHYVSSYGLVGALTNFHPYVISVWGSDIYDFPKESMLAKQIVKFALSKADVICSTSEVMKVETAQYTNKHIYVTPFGVDMERFTPNPNNRKNGITTFGIVKTMKPKYGISYLIEGYKHFQSLVSEDVFKQTKLLIVGGGPNLDEYQQLTHSLGIADQVEFTGNVPHDQVPDMINKIDIFFVPSTLDSESFGVAAVEAQACAVPVVVSDVGGLPEVVLDGETGYIIPHKDSQLIGEKMKELFLEPEKCRQLGDKGREHVLKHYEWIENAGRMVEIYKEMFSGKR